MKRRVGLILLLLVAGAIVNVAVAWGCSWYVLPHFIEAQPMPAEDFWPADRMPQSIAPTQPVGHYEGFGVSEQCAFVLMAGVRSDMKWVCSSVESRQHRVLNGITHDQNWRQQFMAQWFQANSWTLPLRVQSGWPLRSLRGWGSASERWGSRPEPLAGNWAIAAVRKVGDYRVIRLLPFSPLWPGFAINTLFYAALLWMLFAAPFALRRRRRIKRGLCPACAYPVGDSDVCTECGGSVQPRPGRNSRAIN